VATKARIDGAARQLELLRDTGPFDRHGIVAEVERWRVNVN
jgi:hypothetical protein